MTWAQINLWDLQSSRNSWAIRHWWCQVFTPKRKQKTKWEWTVLRTPDLDDEFASCLSFGWKQTAAEHCCRWHTTTLRTGLLPLDTFPRDAKEIGYCFGEPLPTGPNCFEIWCASLYSIYIYRSFWPWLFSTVQEDLQLTCSSESR